MKRWCECKNKKEYHVFEKGYIWNPATCSCENDKYAGSIIDDSVVICNEIIDTTKIVPTKSTSTKYTSTNFYILLAFLLITTALIVFFVSP